jgi:hypothetical protein
MKVKFLVRIEGENWLRELKMEEYLGKALLKMGRNLCVKN